MASERKVHLKIQRQDGPDKPKRWEEFKVPYLPQMNVNSALQQVQKYPTTTEGLEARDGRAELTAEERWERGCHSL